MSVFIVCLIAFVVGYVTAMPVLGPISVMAISRGLEGRFDEARKLGMGAALAEGTYAGIAFSFTTIFTRYPAALPVSRVLTSIVLVVVGLTFVRYKPKPVTPGASEPRRARSAFGLGFLTSGLNPTILATWTAGAAGVHSRQFIEIKMWMAVPFGISAGLGIAAWYVTLIALMTKYHSRLPARGLRISIRVMGGVLLCIAAWTLLSVFR